MYIFTAQWKSLILNIKRFLQLFEMEHSHGLTMASWLPSKIEHHCHHCANILESLPHILGKCLFAKLLRSQRNLKIRILIAKSQRKKVMSYTRKSKKLLIKDPYAELTYWQKTKKVIQVTFLTYGLKFKKITSSRCKWRK